MTPERRRELRFRLWFSLGGLVLWAVAVLLAWPLGPQHVEVFGIAGAFFGGTAAWTWMQLRKE